jgi:hypothetical protein
MIILLQSLTSPHALDPVETPWLDIFIQHGGIHLWIEIISLPQELLIIQIECSIVKMTMSYGLGWLWWGPVPRHRLFIILCCDTAEEIREKKSRSIQSTFCYMMNLYLRLVVWKQLVGAENVLQLNYLCNFFLAWRGSASRSNQR